MLPSLLVLLFAQVADARVLPAPVYAADEEELRSLYVDGALTEEDFELLVELLGDPVDINRARRNALYDLPGITASMARTIADDRKANGPFASVDALLRIDGMTADVVEQLRPFAEAMPVRTSSSPVRGSVKARTALHFAPEEPLTHDHPGATHDALQLGYGRAPNSYLQARLRYRRWLKVGFMGLAQDGVNALAWDPASRDFYASWGGPYLEFGKAYAQLQGDDKLLILGSYTAGFGLGLAFDSTNRTHPHGLYPDLMRSGTDRYTLRKGQMGVAGSLERLDLGGAWLDTTAFASSWRYDAYQYDVGVSGGELIDPMLEDEPSPRVWVQDRDGTWVKGGWLNLPNVYQESILGANSTLHVAQDQVEVGLTAYVGALDTSVVRGMEGPDDIVLRGGFPQAHTYGAVGLNGAWFPAFGEVRLEGAQSFTGGQAVLLKGLVDLPRHGEIETSLRHYGKDFDNPHARGLAAPDEYGGMRDRDEQGARIKLTYDPTLWLGTRLFGDIWRRPSSGATNLELYARVEYKPTDRFKLMLYADHKNRDLANNGRARVYGGDWTDYGEYGLDEPADFIDIRDDVDIIEGAGARNYAGTQVRWTPLRPLTLTATYKRIYTDTAYWYPGNDPGEFCEYWFQVGHYAWAKVKIKPSDSTVITLRGRYEDEDVRGAKGRRYTEGYLQVSQKLPKKIKLSLRGTLVYDMADPENAWRGTCESSGAPDLCGTCVCEDDDTAGDDAGTETRTQGYLWATVDWRF